MKHYKAVSMAGLVVATGSLLALAWNGQNVSPWRFELLVALIGIGFGPLAPLCTVVLQNSVPIHQFGTALGTMNFTRNLLATMMVAIFGAIVLAVPLAGGRAALPPAIGSLEGFTRVFLAAAASLSLSLLLLLALKEKPLHTDVPRQAV